VLLRVGCLHVVVVVVVVLIVLAHARLRTSGASLLQARGLLVASSRMVDRLREPWATGFFRGHGRLSATPSSILGWLLETTISSCLLSSLQHLPDRHRQTK
jgi:hypothetical protein